MSLVLKASRHTTITCCGLTELGAFRAEHKPDWFVEGAFWGDKKPTDRRHAYYGVTGPGQKKTGERLKKLGFKPVGKWNGTYGAELTMWLWTPPKIKRKK